MDAHFNAYKAKYDLMDHHLAVIKRAQYVTAIDIFVNFDDIFWNLHRPWVEKEAEILGINAGKQLAVEVLNVLAHYRKWAYNNRMKCRVFGFWTSHLGTFKNSIYLPQYRNTFSDANLPTAENMRFVNAAISQGMPLAKTICDYVEDVFIIDSNYLEPSIIPLMLKERELATYRWSMLVSRDMYDLQYAYRDFWMFVCPKGENTRIISKTDLWSYVASREKVINSGLNIAYYTHDLYPLALSINGDRRRSIPRLRRIGWKTIFQYLDKCTDKETVSTQIISGRFLDLMQEKGMTIEQVEKNLSCVNVGTQLKVTNDIDVTSVRDQMKYVTDHDTLDALNRNYFANFPINIPFLIAGSKDMGIYQAVGGRTWNPKPMRSQD